MSELFDEGDLDMNNDDDIKENRYCKDCRWYIKQYLNVSDQCSCPEFVQKSLIDGSPRVVRCQFARWDEGLCGEEGKYWEMK